jgi:type II secretory pathway component PulJ
VWHFSSTSSSRRSPAGIPEGAGGWTLLELLLALGVGVLITGVMYAIYSTAVRVKEDQQGRRSGPHRTAEILHQLSDDLTRAWLPKDDEAGVFVLDPAPAGIGGAPTLSFTTMVADAHDPDPRWADAVAVRYQPLRAAAGIELLRVHRPLAGPGAAQDPVTNRLGLVEAFEVKVFDGAEWLDAYRSEDTDLLPAAVRLTLDLPDHRGPSPALTTEVMIPFGLKVSSTLQRGTMAEP